MTGLGRLLGPHVAQSVALTGSDPYFRTGTDLAVLFEAQNPAMLETLLPRRFRWLPNASRRPSRNPARSMG